MANAWAPPDDEPRRVLLIRDSLLDPARGGRDIPLKLYYPAAKEGERFPLILWSDGLGGSVDGAGFLSRFLCANGYVVLHIQHPGTDSRLWEGKPGHPWDVIRNTHIPRKASLDRFLDIPFVLDNL